MKSISRTYYSTYAPKRLYRTKRNNFKPMKHITSTQSGIVFCLFEDEDDQYFAYENIQSYMERSIKGPSSSKRRHTDTNHDTEMAYTIASRFRHGENFSKTLGEDMSKSIVNFIDACSAYDSNPFQNIRFFNNQIDGEARRFYSQPVNQGIWSSVIAAKTM